jgi:hypothetical protein
VNTLRVTRMLKIAIPVTCVIILLFGAPLATSTQRGGAAFGVGLSLGTTSSSSSSSSSPKPSAARGSSCPSSRRGSRR